MGVASWYIAKKSQSRHYCRIVPRVRARLDSHSSTLRAELTTRARHGHQWAQSQKERQAGKSAPTVVFRCGLMPIYPLDVVALLIYGEVLYAVEHVKPRHRKERERQPVRVCGRRVRSVSGGCGNEFAGVGSRKRRSRPFSPRHREQYMGEQSRKLFNQKVSGVHAVWLPSWRSREPQSGPSA